MAEHHLERERKFDVPAGFSLPSLDESGHHTYELHATYYDTDDGLLQAQGVTLRRRVGGKDDGWHLKAPHPDGKVEIHVESDSTEPPGELTALTRGLRFDRPLRERAILRTTREAYEFHTNDHGLIAEVADDWVEAVVVDTQEVRHWHEVEVELGPAGTDDVGNDLAERLLVAGVTPAKHRSKLARALGEPARREPLAGLGGLVDDYLQTQYEQLAWGDLRLRQGDDVTHKTRVAVRRIRSTLRVFAPLFGTRAAYLEAELSWYADVLGRARDLSVVRRTVDKDVATDADGLLPREAVGRLDGVLEEEGRRAWEHLLAVLESERYHELLREIDRWRRDAPMTPEAAAKPKRVERYVRKAEKKSDKRLKRASSMVGHRADLALHRARKAAKRTRYAAELAEPALGKSAKRIAKTYEKRQDGLGELQDHVMTIETLRHVGTADGASDLGFLCGVLAQRHVREKAEAQAVWR